MRIVVFSFLVAVLPACGDTAPSSDPVAIVTPAEIARVFASAEKAAIEVLIDRMQHDAARYEETLVANLSHADRGVREWSAHALGDLGLDAESTIDALIKAFDDEDDWVRWKAVRALGLIGPRAARALSVIEPAANATQETEVVRAAAQVAVRRIRGTGAR